MFLDEKLYQHTIHYDLQKELHIETLVNDLYKICEDHWQPKLTPTSLHASSYKEVTIELDKVFNAWDLFTRRLAKSNYVYAPTLSLFSYKTIFMKNEKAKRIYELGK